MAALTSREIVIFCTYLQFLDTSEKNCNISCRSKILSSWTFLLLKVIPGICVTVKTRSNRHTENISLGSEPRRHILGMIFVF